MPRKKKKGHKASRDASNIFCNPDICPHCQYIGDGDSLCDETNEIVLSGWEPTDSFMDAGCPYLKQPI